MKTIAVYPEFGKMFALTGSRFVISPDGWTREMDAFMIGDFTKSGKSVSCTFYIGSVPYFKLQKRVKFGAKGQLIVNVSGTDYNVGTYREGQA